MSPIRTRPRHAHTLTETLCAVAVLLALLGFSLFCLSKIKGERWWWAKSMRRGWVGGGPQVDRDGYLVNPDKPVYDRDKIRRDASGNVVTYGDLFPNMVRPSGE